jgi:hypothetical protein
MEALDGGTLSQHRRAFAHDGLEVPFREGLPKDVETVRTEGVVLSETVAGKFVPAIDAHGRVLINRCHKPSLFEIQVPNPNNTLFSRP